MYDIIPYDMVPYDIERHREQSARDIPMAMRAINPATGELIAEYAETSDRQLEEKLALAAECFTTCRETSFADRSARMRRAGELLRERSARYGRLMTEEMGKPIAAAEA